MKKAAAFVMVLAIIMASGISALAAGEPGTSIDKAMGYYREQSAQEDFSKNFWHSAIAATVDGLKMDTRYEKLYTPAADIDVTEETMPTEIAGHIISQLLDGKKKDAVKTYSDILVSRQGEDGEFWFMSFSGEKVSSVENIAFSMWALDMADGEYNVESAVNALAKKQKADGGFNEYGETGSVDSTGFVIIALARNKDSASKDIVARALDFLAGTKNENGYFVGQGEYDRANSCSQAVAILALIAAREDIKSDRWSTNGKSPVAVLEENQDENGGFWYNIEDKTMEGAFFTAPDGMSTEQAVLAIASANSKNIVFYQIGGARFGPDVKMIWFIVLSVAGIAAAIGIGVVAASVINKKRETKAQ